MLKQNTHNMIVELNPEQVLQASQTLNSSFYKPSKANQLKSPGKRGVSAEGRRSSYTTQQYQLGQRQSKDDLIHPKQFIIYENLFNDFVLVDEVNEEQTKQIIIYSDKELLSHINNNQIHELRKSDVQATIWAQNLTFQTRKQLWLKLGQVEQLKVEYDYFNYRQNRNKSNQKKDQEQIQKDLHRTFNNDKGIKDISNMIDMLKNVLIAYSNFDPLVGYTQGMNFVVGNLLFFLVLEQNLESDDVCVIDSTEEENVFWLLVFIMQKREWRTMYLQDTPGVFCAIQKVNDQIKWVAPKILTHLDNMGINQLAMLFGSYYISILTHVTPVKLTEIVLSLFLYDGLEFFTQLIIGVLQEAQQQILSLDDVGAIMNFFRIDLFRDFESHRQLIMKNGLMVETLQRLNLLSDTNYCKGYVIDSVQDNADNTVQGEEKKSVTTVKNIKAQFNPFYIGTKIKQMFRKHKKDFMPKQ